MALGLGYVDGPELGGSLIIFFGVMMAVAAVVEDNGPPRETFITLYGRGRDYLRRILFRRALKCGDSSIGGEWVSGKTYLELVALRSAPQGRGWDLLFLPL
jgi:hypothetical protein